MRASLDTAGERLAIDCSLQWVGELIAEGAGGELRQADAPGASLDVRVEARRDPFDTRGWETLTRGAWRRQGEVVVENACTSGFDLHLRRAGDCAELAFRWRPPARDRAAAWGLRSRFHLLARAVLLQYPALWRAGHRGRAPLHASACTAGSATPLVSAAGGIGRSTLILAELDSGGVVTSDNLGVFDGHTVWGLVEPLRVENGTGRRMPHGRSEAPLPNRARALEPDCLVVLERGHSADSALVPCSPATAAHNLVTSTYMAGELRRYWSFAATLAAGTQLEPGHPPIAAAAEELARRLPCFRLALGTRRTGDVGLAELLDGQAVAA